MQYFTCKCGETEAWTSGEMPAKCTGCPKCNTVPGYQPTEPVPHEYEVAMVDTDDGPKPRSYCRWCYKSKQQIEGAK